MEKPLTVAVNNGFTLIENEERRCLMVERLLEEPEDALHFEDKTLIQVITDCHATRTAARSQQKHQGALPVVVKVTNALRFFFF